RGLPLRLLQTGSDSDFQQTMSTLTDFDTITNQNVIAGFLSRLTSVPKQCMVMDGSRLFAGNPSLPCAPPAYGSGQFEAAALFEQAVQYAAATTAAAASQAPFHSTVPPIYSPSPSGNNNMMTTNDTTISSQIDEGCSLDDDEDSSILSNLPNSCHDFELKELHIRLERNHSSPLIGGHSSPALSSRLSSNCPSAEPPTDPAEPEDLEVQFINECFEEQQRQSQMYQSGDLKTLFYHGSSELDSSKVTNRSGTDKSGQSSLERPERLPYAKKLSAHDPLNSIAQYDSHPITSPTFLNLSENFEPLLTPKSEALIQKRVRRDQKASPSRRRVSEPLAQKPPLFWGSGLRIEGAGFGSGELFESIDSTRSFIEDKKRHISFDNYFRGSTPISDCATPDSIRCEDETEALAKGVIESLFSGVALTPLTPAQDFKEELRKVSATNQNKAVRKLYMDNLTVSGSPEKLPKDLLPVMDLNKSSTETATKFEPIAGLSDASGQSGSQVKSVDVSSSIPEEPTVVGDDDGDSWENLDDTKLEQQMNALKLEVASKAPRRPINYFAPPVEVATPWDPFLLPHVLEAYDVPEYKLAEDVVNALAATDWGNATVKWLERKIVFVVFASERQARDALVLHKHQWLRLRPLSKSPARVQEKAREIQAQLKPTRARPKTNAGVARRMVESTLGMRSSISKEQRDAERKQLSDAKAAKKNSVRWDD
ncbi:hypothetical protein V3C99_017486, partial [Haemonchus contortus]